MNEAAEILRRRLKLSSDSLKQFSEVDLEPERHLHTTKWFDYRFMSPLDATYLFRTEFQKAYRAAYARNIDTEESERKFGTRIGLAKDNRAEFTSLWRARQFADELGMPYDLFLSWAFEVLLRGSFQRIPYANQLYGATKARIAAAAQEKWAEHCQTRLVYSTLPHYRSESFANLPAQVAHQDWVLEQLATKSDHTIGRACYSLRLVSEEQVKLKFGEERAGKARELAEDEVPVPHERQERHQLLPSCAALPGATSPSSPECSACKVARTCTGAVTLVHRYVEAEVGTTDPVGQRRRDQGKERTRRHRAKRKAVSAGTAAA